MEEFSDEFFSVMGKSLKTSEIRELLKLTEKPEVISFAGGLPAPITFPTEELSIIMQDVLEKHGPNALQYSTTEGAPALREEIAKMVRKDGMNINADEVLITHGSQQGLDLISKVFIDPGSTVIMEAPTYLGAINAFKNFGANVEEVPIDNDGMIPDALEEKLDELDKKNVRPRLVYIMPTFHNPAGVTLPENRRRKIMEIVSTRNLLLVEDDPYGKLRYSGEDIPTMKSMDKDGRVIYLATFSKLMSPGFRMAFTIASGNLMRKLVLAKQATDLCSNSFGQYVSAEFISRGLLEKHIPNIIRIYRSRRDAMLKTLNENFPSEVEWTKPDGGMFVWATCPEKINTTLMFHDALMENVAYVTGASFYAKNVVHRNMRLNFSYCREELIFEGIKRLANVLKKKLNE